MTNSEQKANAKKFAEFWERKIEELNKGNERSFCQLFWVSFLRDILGVEEPEKIIVFEEKIKLDEGNGFIDVRIPKTKVLIEQKSSNKNLRDAIKQSDGSLLSPLQQAKRYIMNMAVDEHPKWVITCNFKSFLIYNMNNVNGEPEEILLKDLHKECYRFNFLIEEKTVLLKKEEEISIKAGELVGSIYEKILPLYKNPTNEESLKSLNMLCVRIVFCLYAEDSDIFGRKNMFHDYLIRYDERDLRRALIDLFKVLDTKVEDRDPYLQEDLAMFPYVNGGLFADENIEIPNLTNEVKELLLSKGSDDFDWSEISPTIFGAVFESTLNPDTRRKGGMHYTSIENIHKVIDPLFLDELKEELDQIKQTLVIKTRENKLKEFQNKLASLNFLDPACGSGNFLTETYLSLRSLENEVVKELVGDQIAFGDATITPIKVSISQFYGIEINDFAVTVAKTALWIAESQMMKKTENLLHINLEFLPLKSYTNIIEGNALDLDWNDIISTTQLKYIMGNPPFVGARLMSESQKEDMMNIFEGVKNYGNLDYVSCWYKKAADYIKNTTISVAFVSTNSICQGEQPSILWKNIMNEGIIINFAYRTFRWDSEASLKAHVHCIIVGFSYENKKEKYLFDNGNVNKVKNINAYLIEANNIFIESRAKPICNVSKMEFGSMPNDGGHLSNYSKEEKESICRKYPNAEKFFKKILGAEEFINSKDRYCIWLKDIEPGEYKNIIPIMDAIKKVKEMRESSEREATKKLADVPFLFGEIRQPTTNYLIIPRVSSEKRRYIPIGFIESNIISSDAIQLIPTASLYEFGILTSNVHMAWMRIVAGRLKSDYRYSAKIVYNNFPFPTPSKEQILKIEETAQGILDTRKKYLNSSLADLYNDDIMPVDLRNAHRANDRAVMQAYGFPVKNEFTESMCVAELMKLYEELVKTKEN